jgi:hypothetical protein
LSVAVNGPNASNRVFTLVKPPNMAGAIYYRDPHNPRDVFGPFAVEQLRDFVKQGRLRATDQISFDEHSWMPATELEPELFPAGATDWLAGQPAWKRTAIQVVEWLKAAAIAAWNYIKLAADFYWTQRKDLRLMATEYFSFLKDPGSRREIRVTAEEQNEAVLFENDQWRADLPDCCVVCGEPADCDWNREQRSISDLTWPFLSPIFGLLFGIVGWIFLWNSQGRWLIPLGLFAGFLLGYRLRRETIVTVRFRRCREHLNRTRLPWLRIFRKTLIIGIGDRKVWRRFYYGERDLEVPQTVPPDFSKAVESTKSPPNAHGSGPSYPTIPLVDDSEMNSGEGSS